MPIFTLYARTKKDLPIRSSEQPITAIEIHTHLDVIQQLKQQLSDQVEDKDIVHSIIRSPAFYSISSIPLSEYIKNSVDANATALEIYVNIDTDNEEINCAIVDNGKGFDAKCLGRESDPNKRGMVDYYKVKLENGALHKIVSTKTNKPIGDDSQLGGRGLGLASAARILTRVDEKGVGKGKLEIGNVRSGDLPWETAAEMDQVAGDHGQPRMLDGAVTLVTSELYSKKLFAQYDANGNDGNYVEYVHKYEGENGLPLSKVKLFSSPS